jgi:hypothetical protein
MFYNKKTIWRIASIFIWSTLGLFFGLGLYVNHFLPHGPTYPTGWTCDTTLRSADGECGPTYKEDLSKVDIPGWAKLVRKTNDSSLFVVVGLIIAGIVATSEARRD